MSKFEPELTGSEAVNGGHLTAFIERIERLEEEKKALVDDIKDVYAEAKGTGFDVKVMRSIVNDRKQDRKKLREFQEIKDLYEAALGQLADTPLGRSATTKATYSAAPLKSKAGDFKRKVQPVVLSAFGKGVE